MSTIIADTGPIIASIYTRDRHHAWASRTLQSIEPPMLTCEAAVTEMCFVLGPGESHRVLGLLENGMLRISFSLQDELEEVVAKTVKYADQPMSLADACLVRMSELYPDHRVFTLDSDFRVYRRFGRRVIPLLTP